MKKPLKNFAFFCGLLFSIVFFSDTANACSCMGYTDVRVAVDDSHNVAILKIDSIEELKNDENFTYEKVNLSVKKVFKGDVKVGEKYSFSQKGNIRTSCDRNVQKEEVGEDYLFYAGNLKSGESSFGLWTCGRSRAVKYHAMDLLYLEKLEKVRGKTRLSGYVYQYVLSTKAEKPVEYNFLSSKKVRIIGKNTNITLKTDKNGVFEIYDLPPGKYKLSAEEIPGFSYSEEDQPIGVEIKAKSHTELDIVFKIKNAISGKLFDANGRALEDVCLDLIPKYGKMPTYFYGDSDCTDKDGEFEFREIPIGIYIIVINKDGKITSDEPFETFYYPNVKNKEDAAAINVDAGFLLENLVINAPETFETITVSGRLLFEDNNPVANKSVRFLAVKEESEKSEKYESSDASTKTDENGRFTIRILKGQTGKLFGSMYLYSSESKNCPKIEELLSKREGTDRELKTSEVTIDASDNLSGIDLIFPFPGCKKAKND